MMKTILEELIRLNVSLEGYLRVALQRESPEALESARETLERIDTLFASLDVKPSEGEATCIKDSEAESAELPPVELPAAPVERAAPKAVIPEEPTQAPSAPAEPAAPYAPAEQPAPVEAAPAAPEDKPVEPVTVDDVPARRECRDLRKSFTLNDKFLFRRELFGGSDQEFYDTIDLLTAMNSLDEAREYIFDDLQWDPENEVVKDFMDIVTSHFKSNPA